MAIFRIVPSRVRGFEVHITRSKLKDGKYTLYGRLHRKSDQAAIGKRIEHQYDPDKSGDDTAVQAVAQRVDDAYEASVRASVASEEKKPAAQGGIFSKAFEIFLTEVKAHPK